jgi:hypothetical protein
MRITLTKGSSSQQLRNEGAKEHETEETPSLQLQIEALHREGSSGQVDVSIWLLIHRQLVQASGSQR